ncbi:MAG: DUF3160 domain-containing protein [Bacteroidetes bacterium]|nr:DUF3160 domain-containing protein [Bacteroidota bacterium]
MKHWRQVVLAFFLFGVLGSGFASSQTFDVDAYRQFLAGHQDMEGTALLDGWPAPLLRKNVVGPVINAAWLDSIRIKYDLTKDELDLVAENGFMVSERLTAKTFQEAYEEIWHKDLPVAVTTDAILHAVHMSYDRILKDTEYYFLIGELRTVVDGLHAAQENLQQRYAGNPAMQPMLADIDLYLGVAWKLLTKETRLKYPENMTGFNALLSQIAAESPSMTTLFSTTPRLYDFSQFTVRGHYTDKDRPELGRYFQSMIWIGRTEFMLTKPVQHDMPQQTDEDIQRQVIDACLLAQLLDEANVGDRVTAIDRLLELLVGESDNVRASHLKGLLADLGFADPSLLLDMQRVKEFQALLATKPFASQRINSQILYSNPMDPEQLAPPSAFLLLGQRFIIDSYVFGNVVYDKILFKGQKVRRMLPMAMDALFALGNDAAAQFLQEEFTRYPYATNLASLRYLVDSYGEDFWSASLYNSWLNAIRALNIPDETESLPPFMQTAAWWQQKMNTQLASWSQLRHDNLLYAKQSYSGGFSCSFPEAYVEPFPEFYGRLAAFARKASDVYRNISWQSGVPYFFDRMATSMDTLETIASKELSGTPLTAQERTFGKGLLYLFGMCGKQYDGWYLRLFYGAEEPEEDYITADVHTAPTDAAGAPIGWVYHVGTGRINLGVIVAPAEDGTPTAFMAPMLSFHEHVTTNFERLTDEEWEAMLDRGAFTRPEWTNNWLADAQGTRRLPGPSLLTMVTAVPSAPVAEQLLLQHSYPNPFHGSSPTTISFALRNAGEAMLAVYDLGGRRVRTLLQNDIPAGAYMSRWDGRDDAGRPLPSGSYMIVLDAFGQRGSSPVVLLR